MEQSFYDTIEYIQADNYVRAKEECQKALDLAEDVYKRQEGLRECCGRRGRQS